jgi:hypothetical protein
MPRKSFIAEYIPYVIIRRDNHKGWFFLVGISLDCKDRGSVVKEELEYRFFVST